MCLALVPSRVHSLLLITCSPTVSDAFGAIFGTRKEVCQLHTHHNKHGRLLSWPCASATTCQAQQVLVLTRHATSLQPTRPPPAMPKDDMVIEVVTNPSHSPAQNGKTS
jgi:hypothetical protein